MRQRNLVESGNFSLEVYDEKVIIRDTPPGSGSSQRAMREILYSSLSGVRLIPATRNANGQLIFLTKHSTASVRMSDNQNQEHTFFFSYSKHALILEVFEFVERQISRDTFSSAATSKRNVAEEISQLVERLTSGELTMDEFEIEKRKILKRS